MYALFPKILNMSLTGSIVILFVLLARCILKKSPKIFSYVLWGIVLFRLLCPAAFTSDLSVLTLWNTATSPQTSLSHSVSAIEQNLSSEYTLPTTAQDERSQDEHLQHVHTSVPDSSDPSPLRKTILLFTTIWICGILILSGYSFFSLCRLRRKLIGAIPATGSIYLADHIATPFVLGIFRPRIYLPSSLTEEQVPYILLHEQHHIRRGDPFWKMLAFIALCLHWFNPLVWLAFFLSAKDMEMSCDEAVMRRMGEEIRSDYSASLLSLATGRRILAGVPLAFGEGNTKDRIHHVLNWKKPRTWVIILSLILCAILGICLMTDPGQNMSFTGACYEVECIVYDAPQYSFIYTAETTPHYMITPDSVLMRREVNDTDWQVLGTLTKTDYSREELYSLFEPLSCSAQERIDQVTEIYRTDVSTEDSHTFYLILLTKERNVLFAHGYGEGLSGHIRWLFALSKTGGSYDLNQLLQDLQAAYGESAQYFSLYDYEGTVFLSQFWMVHGGWRYPNCRYL